MHFLVTGGLGFVGSRFIELARDELEEPTFTILDNLSVGKPENLKFLRTSKTYDIKPRQRICLSDDIDLIHGDISQMNDVASVKEEVDIIIHLAGNTGVQPSLDDPWLDMTSNVIGTMNILEYARSKPTPPRVIFSSSNAPLGEAEQPVNENSPCAPLSPYGASKLAAEGYLSAYNASFGVPTVSLRFGNLYGVGSTHKSSVVAKFIKHALAGEDWPIYGDGTQSRDFLYLDDLIEAIIKSTQIDEASGEVFQISTGKETTILELCEVLKQTLLDRSIQVPPIINLSKRAGDMPKNYSDVSKAKNILGWEAKTKLNEGLDKTLDWFLS